MRMVLLLGLLLGLATSVDADEMQRVRHAEAFVAAINAADLDAYVRYCEEHRVRPADDKSEESYLKLVERFGRMEVGDVRVMGDVVVLSCASAKQQGEIELSFRFEAEAPYRVDSLELAVSTSGGSPESDMPAPDFGKDPSDAKIAKVLDGWLKQRAEDDEFSGTVVLTRDGKTVYEGAFGLAHRAYQIPNRIDTLYRVGSITKSFTMIAVARLIEQGKLRADATVAEILPGYPRLDIAGAITVEQLLAHTSGLGGMNYLAYLNSHAPKIRRPMDYVALFADEPLLFEPGSRREYSNAGYIVLGAILEAAGGKKWERLVEEFVFEPAGMKASCFVDLDRPQVAVAMGYWHCDPQEPDLWCENTSRLELVATAGGGSYSTAWDLIRFDRALRAGRLLSPGMTNWYFGGPWPKEGDEAPKGPWPGTGIAGGAEGVSAVLLVEGDWKLSVTGNLGGDAAEHAGIAIADGLGILPKRPQ